MITRSLVTGLVSATALAGAAPVLLAAEAPTPSELEARLLAEFADAYPAEAPIADEQVAYQLRAAPTETPMFDGRPFDVWSYNGLVPGPPLRVRLGESIRVVLTNELPQPTTIHWHGVRVPNAMDGVPGVTQAPVEPGETFVYEFTPKDAGTFWFHPHVRSSEQVERGLYGTLVVDDAVPLPYSRDALWVLDDWLLQKGPELYPYFNTRRDLMHDGRWGNLMTVNGSYREELVVRPGERLRLRLVNTANGRVFRPSFDALDVRVIAVDGMYTLRPLAAEGFDLAPGNRLDLDVQIAPDAAGQAFEVVDNFGRAPFPLARIRVEGEPIEVADFQSPSNPRVPGWEGAHDAPLRAEYVLDARTGREHGIEWTLNGVVWKEALEQGAFEELLPNRFHRVRFTNASFRLHPMHLHGQFFKVLARDGKPVDEPYFRDTVLLRSKETVDIGLVPLDWGRWMMHCHILEHAEAGMMTAVDVPPIANED